MARAKAATKAAPKAPARGKKDITVDDFNAVPVAKAADTAALAARKEKEQAGRKKPAKQAHAAAKKRRGK